MRLRGIRLAFGLAAAALFVVLLIELFAYTTWLLSGAGRVEADAEAPSSPAPHEARPPVGHHAVREWPAGRNRAEFREAPMLEALVEASQLPPVTERLPANPLVIVPPEQCGPYGGTWTRFATSVGDIGVFEARLAYEGLVRWDPMGREILPNLAVRWEIEDQGRTFTFWLRRGVRWSDGVPFTADDIVFWYEDTLNNRDLTPVVPREWKTGEDPVQLDQLDAYTVRFRFAEPKGLFLKQLASGQGYAIVANAAHYFRQFHPRYTPLEELEAQARAEGVGQWYRLWRKRASYVSNPDRPFLWAWVVKTPAPAQPVVFERNPYYWKVDPQGNQLPYIDRVTFDTYDPELINMKAVEGGIGMQTRHLEFSNFPLFTGKQQSGGYRALEWPNAGGGTLLVALNLNHQDPVMHDIIGDRRFRIALSHAIDRDEINEVGYFGMGMPRQNGPPATSPYYMPEYEKAYIEYDPERARQLLDDMGLNRRNRNGVRLRPDGKPIQLFIDMASMSGNAQLLELVAEYWTAVGVKTDLKLLARELFYRRKAALMHDCGVWWPSDEQEPTIDPRWFLPFSQESIQGIDYATWFRTGGRKGAEPPTPIRRCIELYQQIELETESEVQIRLFKDIIELNRQHLWVIGTIGDVPAPVIVKDTFRNVPDEALCGWIFRTPGNTAPECYAIAPAQEGA